MSNFQDFDAFFAELDRKPLTFKIRGEVFELPPDIPASIVKHIVDLQKASIEIVPDETVLDMGKHILGQETLDRLIDELNLDMFELGKIIDWAVLTYMGNGADALGKTVEAQKKPRQRKKKSPK